MAEYYPLLVRAVAALPNATPETRRSVYERARQALIGQLRKIDPPVPESDIERESRALDEAVAKLEAELSAKAKTDTTAKSTAPPPRPSLRSPASPPAGEPRPGFPSTLGSGVRTPRPVAETKPSSLSEKPVQSAAVPPRPPAPPPLRSASPRNPAAAAPPIGPAQREPRSGPNLPPPVRAPEPTGAAKDPANPPETSTLADAVSAEKQPLAEPGQSAAPAKAGWRQFGRSRDDRPSAAADAASIADDAQRVGTAEIAKSTPGRGEAVRPLAPQPKPPRSGSARHWIVGSVVGALVVVIAGMAIMLKDNPEELARRAHLAAPPTAETSPPPGKIAQRVGGAQTAAPAVAPAATTPPATAPSAASGAGAPASSPPADNILPVAQRAALLVQAPDQPQQTKTYVGTVVWRRENVNHGQDQPLSEAVRADIDLPEAKLKATMIFQKNTDATLPASHTIELRFMPAPDSPIPAVKQIDVPQLRKEDTPTGDPLAGVPAPITQNYFLVGLTQGDAAVARNIDLIKSREWFDIPLLLDDNKIAKITFEKGDPGDRALSDAFADWQR